MDKRENLSFSKEVAETLGLECAIILNLLKESESNDISSQDRLLAYVINTLPFIDPQKIEKSIDKLNKFNLIDFDKEPSKKDYAIKKPSKNLESRQIDPDWQPSEDTLEIIKMTSISNDFVNLKLKEFRIYWTERGQKKNNWNITFLDFIRREWAHSLLMKSKKVMFQLFFFCPLSVQ